MLSCRSNYTRYMCGCFCCCRMNNATLHSSKAWQASIHAAVTEHSPLHQHSCPESTQMSPAVLFLSFPWSLCRNSFSPLWIWRGYHLHHLLDNVMCDHWKCSYDLNFYTLLFKCCINIVFYFFSQLISIACVFLNDWFFYFLFFYFWRR